MGWRAKRECFACGRIISVQFAIQNQAGGKARVKHKCPHGAWCISGSPLGRAGCNLAPIYGPHACAQCHKERQHLLTTKTGERQ
jgi:hypothetical protein